MGYDKGETEKTNRYTFRWSLAYLGRGLAGMMVGYVLCMVAGIIFMPLIIQSNLGRIATYILVMGVVPLTIELAVILYLFHRSGNGAILYTTIEPKRITIARICGKTILEGVSSIEHVTKEELDENTSYTSYDSETDTESTHHGLSMSSDKLSSSKYGEFTCFCVNFKELAMVTCADGKKYLINYPEELFEQTSSIHVYKPKLKLKWRIGRVIGITCIILLMFTFPELIGLLFNGMFIEFLLLLLVCFFLLYPFGIVLMTNPIKHIRIGADWISILFSLPHEIIMLENVESIQHVTRKELEDSTTYSWRYFRFQRPHTCRGMSMLAKEFSNYKYGEFTRICNNFDELAMVTLANGKKYLINYPKELLGGKNEEGRGKN